MQPFSEREGGSNTFGYSNSISVCFYKCAISSSDPKGSPFENKTIERTLSVELSGTAGKLLFQLKPLSVKSIFDDRLYFHLHRGQVELNKKSSAKRLQLPTSKQSKNTKTPRTLN